ncbi:MAG TPA: RNA 2',3'-cyclic phosphodiesterase [Solirubrobacteraceae bacterium]|nr:RNA 2',3'-cyclic phosphodiesterase [Solirubrobacteraceae bacterium]
MRLFVALDLPPRAVRALAGFASAAARDGLRLVPAESLHVTLAFLGHRPEEDAEAVAGALEGVPAAPVRLRLGAPAWLPPRRPGVLAVDLVDCDGACARMQSAVSATLVDLGVFTPERRAFRPHVTVARVRKGARVDRDVPEIADAGTFAATSVTLYRSLLSPKGASYHALTRTPLT